MSAGAVSSLAGRGPVDVMQMIAEVLEDVRRTLPAQAHAFFDRYAGRNRAALARGVEQLMRTRGIPTVPLHTPAGAGVVGRIGGPGGLPELWGTAERTKANLRAMHILARKRPEELTDQELRAIAMYSGWGGLSIQKVAHLFPQDFPAPEKRGLIHDYYISLPLRS